MSADGVLVRCRRVQLSTVAITFVSFITAGIIIASGVLGTVFFDPLRLAVNVLHVCTGLLSITADVKAFSFFAYAKFLYLPVGRGLYYIIIGLIVLQKGLLDIILGASIITLGVLYTVACLRSGGVPKPLTQLPVEELPLSAVLKFVES
ncbi:hypothetical protein BESB_010160 [Besnoitia besnoiti]|uniref:COPI associated protein n=1 Tax=Besnoitia besnoiti TaxID=94643 RepID=A0A2A9MMR8_BESBE|nr:hypothetical protein BESB_010160 [Besnoitia besnoiti]PFH38674.1 hypothetical protein BESB_010160 [Besnoitia besnoiti]